MKDEAVFIKAKVCRKDIFYLNSIIEAYDGLALMSTLDAPEGIVGFCTPEEQLGDLLELLDNLAQEILIEFSVIRSVNSAQSINLEFLKKANLGEDSGG